MANLKTVGCNVCSPFDCESMNNGQFSLAINYTIDQPTYFSGRIGRVDVPARPVSEDSV